MSELAEGIPSGAREARLGSLRVEPVHPIREDGGRLHIAYEVVGEGPFDLVYVPGWFSNLEVVWEMPDLGDFLREIATFSRLIVFDRRGFGLSDRPFTTEALSHEVGMDDIRTVMDDAGSERAVLFGWEDGGCQSLLYAASYPERTSALILFGIWVKYSASPDYPWGWTPEGTEHIWELLANKWGTEDFWRELTGFSSAIASDPQRVQAWARYSRLSASPGSAVALERRDFETDVRAVLPSIQVPTLIMHRVGDTAERFEQARYIGERITGAEVVELPGSEHAPFMGDTDAVLNRVRAFVGAIREEEAEFDRVLATVLFTDLVGSTEQAVALGDRAWRELVERHHATIRGLLARYRGNEVDTAGDGFFATFDGPARAVRCADAIVGAVNHSVSRSAQAFTPERSRRSTTSWAVSQSISAHALRQSQGQARFWCHQRSRTSRQGPGLRSRMRASMS